MKNYLNFETEIKDLETELDKLKDPFNQSGLSEVDTQRISKTQMEIDEKLKSIKKPVSKKTSSNEKTEDEFLKNFNWHQYQEGIDKIDEKQIKEFEKLVQFLFFFQLQDLIFLLRHIL